MHTRQASKSKTNFPALKSPQAFGNVKVVNTNKVLMPINPLFDDVKFDGEVRLKAIERNYAER